MDLFDGPLTADIDPRIAQGLLVVVDALGALDTGMKRVREAAPSVETAMGGVAQRAGAAAASLATSAESFTRSANRFGREAAEGFRGLTEMAHTVEAFATGVSRLAAEQQRLDRINRETGLNLERIAASSERYMSQLDAAKVVEQFAAARMNLSQVEAEALAQGAARLAQMFDTSVEEQGRRLFSAISRGEIEVLQTLGPHMASLSGQTHSANERLTAFIDHLGELGPATEDAATRLERMEGAVHGLERSFSGGFVDEAQRLFAGVGTADDDMTHLAAGMRQLGRDAADLAGAVVNLAMVPVLAVGTLVSALADELGNLIRAAERLAHGDFSGAGAAMGAGHGQDTQDLTQAMMARLQAGGQASARLLGIDTGEEADAPEARGDSSAAAGVMLFGPGSQPSGRPTTARGRGRGGARQPTLDQLMGRAFSDESAARRANARLGLRVDLPGIEVEGEAGQRSIVEMEQDSARKDAEAARREQETFAEGERAKSSATRERMERDRQNGVGARLVAAFDDPDNTPEARAARAIGSAWSNATDALGKHLGLVASGQETWAQFWEGLGMMALKTLADVASTEGKLEFGRALAALAVGNLPGAALHTAAGLALTGVGAALGAAASPAPSAASGGGSARAPSTASPRSTRVPSVGDSSGGKDAPITLVANFGGASFYGSGGPRQAAAEFIDLLNRNAPLSGAVLDARVVGR